MSFTSNVTFEDPYSEAALIRAGRCTECFRRWHQSWCSLAEPEDN